MEEEKGRREGQDGTEERGKSGGEEGRASSSPRENVKGGGGEEGRELFFENAHLQRLFVPLLFFFITLGANERLPS